MHIGHSLFLVSNIVLHKSTIILSYFRHTDWISCNTNMIVTQNNYHATIINCHKLSFNYHFGPFHRKIRYPKALQNRLFCTEHTLFFSNTTSYLAENKQKSSPSLPSECHLHPHLNGAKTRISAPFTPGSQKRKVPTLLKISHILCRFCQGVLW